MHKSGSVWALPFVLHHCTVLYWNREGFSFPSSIELCLLANNWLSY